MVRSIPPGGSIPENERRKKQAELKTKAGGNKMTRHIGARIGSSVSNRPVIRRSSSASERHGIQGKPVVEKRPGKRTLEKLLAWGQQEEQTCMKLLRTLPSELPEYNEVLERLGKLQDVLEQVKRQLTARRLGCPHF